MAFYNENHWQMFLQMGSRVYLGPEEILLEVEALQHLWQNAGMLHVTPRGVNSGAGTEAEEAVHTHRTWGK